MAGLQSGGSRYGSSCPDMIIMIPKQPHPVNPLKRRKEAHEKSMEWVCWALDRCDIGVKTRLFITTEGFFFFTEQRPPMKQSSYIHPQEKETPYKKKKVSSFAADLWELSTPHPRRRPPAPPSCSD